MRVKPVSIPKEPVGEEPVFEERLMLEELDACCVDPKYATVATDNYEFHHGAQRRVRTQRLLSCLLSSHTKPNLRVALRIQLKDQPFTSPSRARQETTAAHRETRDWISTIII